MILDFSGGAYLRKDAEDLRSDFGSRTYNNPNSKFKDIFIFPGGATRRAVD